VAKVVRPEVLKGTRLVEKIESLANEVPKGQQTKVTWGCCLSPHCGEVKRRDTPR
jgi:hypothetical protein